MSTGHLHVRVKPRRVWSSGGIGQLQHVQAAPGHVADLRQPCGQPSYTWSNRYDVRKLKGKPGLSVFLCVFVCLFTGLEGEVHQRELHQDLRRWEEASCMQVTKHRHNQGCNSKSHTNDLSVTLCFNIHWMMQNCSWWCKSSDHVTKLCVCVCLSHVQMFTGFQLSQRRCVTTWWRPWRITTSGLEEDTM